MTRALPRRAATKPKADIGATKPNQDGLGEGILSLDDYNSEEDDDFDPDAVGSGDEDGEGGGGDSEDDENMDSSSDDDEEGKRRRRRRRGGDGGERKGQQPKSPEKKQEAAVGKQTEENGKDEDEGSDESNDEDFGESEEESEGGEGGQVKTRAQRARLGDRDRVPLASMQGATADVDTLWESMNQKKSTSTIEKKEKGGGIAQAAPTADPASSATTPLIPPPSETPTPGIIGERTIINGLPHITISHTYTFAGTTTTTTKLVPLDSAEARFFLSSNPISSTPPPTTTSLATTKPTLRRPLKRTSAFDSGPTAASKAKKINTLEKSRLDWAGFVDKEGIKEDLERQGKGGGYIDRQSFLGRVEERREGVWKEGARGGGSGSGRGGK